MILRANKKILDDYLLDLKDQLNDASIRSIESHLRTFLDFLSETPLEQCASAAKSYKGYLRSGESRRDGKEKPFSPEYIRKNLASVRAFLVWLRDEKEYTQIKETWLKRNLRVTAKESNQAKPNPEEDGNMYFSVEDALQIARTPVSTLSEERIRAACIFLLLSGMRITAFLTMPIKALDLTTRKIKQWPSLGVRTKLSKSATTILIDIPAYPELIAIVQAWDAKVRGTLPDTGMWFANISSVTGELDTNPVVGQYRSSGFRSDLTQFLEKVGIPYKSPHKFRHGHIRFLRDQAENVAEVEAIANNAMQTVGTMLNYGKMSDQYSWEVIEKLSGGNRVKKPNPAPANVVVDSKRADALRRIKSILNESDLLSEDGAA